MFLVLPLPFCACFEETTYLLCAKYIYLEKVKSMWLVDHPLAQFTHYSVKGQGLFSQTYWLNIHFDFHCYSLSHYKTILRSQEFKWHNRGWKQ